MPPLRVCIECGKIVRMARQIAEKLAQKLDQLPNSPGCYQMHNAAGKVIYVGKAVVLRNRVRSYFHASAQHNAKTLALVVSLEQRVVTILSEVGLAAIFGLVSVTKQFMGGSQNRF